MHDMEYEPELTAPLKKSDYISGMRPVTQQLYTQLAQPEAEEACPEKKMKFEDIHFLKDKENVYILTISFKVYSIKARLGLGQHVWDLFRPIKHDGSR